MGRDMLEHFPVKGATARSTEEERRLCVRLTNLIGLLHHVTLPR